MNFLKKESEQLIAQTPCKEQLTLCFSFVKGKLDCWMSLSVPQFFKRSFLYVMMKLVSTTFPPVCSIFRRYFLYVMMKLVSATFPPVRPLFKRCFSLIVMGFLPLQLFAVCLHPLEELALLHGKSKNVSLQDQITQQKKQLQILQDRREKVEEKIADIEINLRNSLDDTHFNTNDIREAYNKAHTTDPPRTDEAILAIDVSTIKKSAINYISKYIEGENDEWDETKGGMPWYHKKGHDTANKVDEYFKTNGKINERDFCEEYAQDDKKKACQKSIRDLERYYKSLSQILKIGEAGDEHLISLEDEEFNRSIGLSDEEDIEGNPLCFECLDELRELDKPTTGQVVGNLLSVVAGGALSYYGYKAGKRESRRVDDLRLRQGYDPRGTAGMSWAGASSGIPLIANGVYGLAGGNSRFGNYACHPGIAGGANAHYGPFAHAHGNYGAYSGAYGPYAQAGVHFGANPYAGAYGPYAQAGAYGAFPGAQVGLQFGANPYAGAYGPYAQAGAYPGAFPGAQVGLQFGANPYAGAYGPYAQAGAYGAFPGAQVGLQFGANPYAGAFPGAQAGLQFGANPYAGAYGPYAQAGAFPGVNAGAMYQQQQYAQYMQYQQIQMQAQQQAQQAWMQHQISLQKDRMQRQQIIGSLTQELHNIQQQIYLIQSGGVTSGLSSYSSLTTGAQIGTTVGRGSPTHSPAPTTNSNTGGDLPVTEGR